MKALVLGGTGFIGRRLVESLVSRGVEVTLATSGKSGNPFGKKVSPKIVDRFNRGSLIKAFSERDFYDCTFDTIGYRSMDVKDSLDALHGKTGKYVYISSAAVYAKKVGILREEDFDPSSTDDPGPGLEKTYYEGKQKSEAYIAANANIPYALVRFPIVMGHDDSTMRFQDHVSRLLKGDEIVLQKPEGRRTYVWVEDAGNFLAWLGTTKNEGIYNGASSEALKTSDLIARMAAALNVEPRIRLDSKQSNSSYSAADDKVLDVEKARKLGFDFHDCDHWIGEESRKVKDMGGNSPNSAGYIGGLFS